MDDPNIILSELNHFKPLIDRAIKLTYDYVSKHKLILTGGMAIDLALREKDRNLAIYSDDEIPDYDIISDESIHHANALAEIFCQEGLPNINVINAVHITTMKVRMKNITFLDATYIPTSCLKKIPYLDVGPLRIVHPHCQFIDQRLSLSHLMADTGISLNIFNRLEKDMYRNSLLRDSYPITPSPSKQCAMRTVSIPLDLIRIDPKRLLDISSEDGAFIYNGPVCVAGYVGFALVMSTVHPTEYKIKITPTSLDMSIPLDAPIRLLSCDIDVLKPRMKAPKTFRPLLNSKPFALLDGHYEYVNSFGKRVSCTMLDIGGVKICVASIDYLLMEMLRDRIYTSEEPFTSWYCDLVSVSDEQQAKENSSNIWWPSVSCYGIEDLPEHRMFILERLMNPDISRSLRPRTSYLSHPKCATKNGFTQMDSHYFKIDGVEDDSIIHTDYRYIMDDFTAFLTKKRSER